MRINHNLAALNTYRQLSNNGIGSQKSLEKLSSGLRINRAGDDAAGLAISEKMRSQIRGLDQAARNSQDGISMIQTSEGALAETQSILQRMKELATQSANGTNTGSDRGEIQKEMNQLSSEINRIGNTTEFNTQKLLRGTTAPVVETAATQTTVTAGETGVVAGAISSLTTNTKSVVAIDSAATVQASSSAATGTVTGFTVNTSSTKGAQGSVSLANGMTFKTVLSSAASNGNTISIVQGAASCVTSITGTTITIGADSAGCTLARNRGELYNQIINATGYSTFDDTYTLDVPAATNEPLVAVGSSDTISGGVTEISGSFEFTMSQYKEAGDTISFGGKTFTAVIGAATASKGEFSIGADAANISTAATQAASLISAMNNTTAGIGTRFTASVPGTSVVRVVEKANQSTGVDLTAATTAGAGTDDKLTITDTSGRNLKSVTIIQNAVHAGCANTSSVLDTSFKLTTACLGTALNGVKVAFVLCNGGAAANALCVAYSTATRTLTVTGSMLCGAAAGVWEACLGALICGGLAAAGFTTGALSVTNGVCTTGATLEGVLNAGGITFGGGATTVTDADTLMVDQNDGNITIHLATTTASKNSASNIQTAIRALSDDISGANPPDFSRYEATASGNWDSKTFGNSLTDTSSTLVGGTAEAKGDYSFDVTTAFAAGDRISIKGQTFVAVASGAVASKGEFNVAADDLSTQAAGIRDAVSLNDTLKATYTAGGSGANVKLLEIAATGVDITQSNLTVTATGIQGQYSVAAPDLLVNGAKFVLDGQEIAVSDKNANVGYDNGTAIKVATSVAEQTTAIAAAINSNENLMAKYTASVGSDGSLVLNQDAGSTTGPVVSTKSTDKGAFTSTFQVGANSGQSMTVEVADMRSIALGITGDGSVTSVKASNGYTASYASTASVTDGTSNKSVEYALDVSTHENATAAIGVLEDSIAAVSAQRSQLGAYQNRLEHTINNLGTSSENLTASESRVRDVDMAKEMMEFTKNNILTQAAQAMLAQANQQPQGVLQLLR